MTDERTGRGFMRIRDAVLAIFLCIFLASCGTKGTAALEEKPAEGEDYLMGTTVLQKVYGSDAEKAVAEVSARIKELEGLMTINAPGGEINRLNEAAGGNAVVLSEETLTILETAKRYAALSHGAFDVTVGPLVKAWGIFTAHPRIPPQDEIDRLLKLVDYRTLIIDRAGSAARLEKPGQMVDLGGIAKGYAGDEAIRIYKEHGLKSAYINLGGNVVVLGGRPDGSPWRIGIQNPRAPNGMYIGIVRVTDKAVVTSGDYERYFEKENVRYHHILDTKTG
jgi:thiamine biosynthesis lipoprotein